MLTGRVLRLPPQSTFWRLLASLHLGIARQLLEVKRRMRERVWEAAHVELAAVTLDTDTTVHTLFGHQMGGRKSYNPTNKGNRAVTRQRHADAIGHSGAIQMSGKSPTNRTARPPLPLPTSDRGGLALISPAP
jgi:hypothetical protein